MKKIAQRLTALLLTGVLACLPSMNVTAAEALAKGVDVSKHQENVNWGSVAANGYSFAFIKAGSTKSGVDPFFDANMRNAQAAGIKTGVYLYSYANNVQEAANEANLLVGWLSNYTVNFPVVYDVENANHKQLSNQTLIDIINTFCSIVSAAGYYPMIYSYRNFYNQKIPNVGYDKWVADYSGSCQYNNNTCFWQYTSSGSVPGISGRVDLNYQYKDYSNVIISDGFANRGEFTYFYAGYKMQRGWVNWNNTRYHLDEAGHLQKGMWFTDSQGTYFLTPEDGQIARGQYQVAGDRGYYFNENGAKQSGWITIGDKRCYYDPANNGRIYTGWLRLDTGTYYLNPAGGFAVTGPAAIEGGNYCFDPQGLMLTGWQDRDEARFLYGPDGRQIRGWFSDASGTYYLNPETGALTAGNASIEGANYCFAPDGKMQTGIVKTPQGDFYYNPADGKRMTGWITAGQARMYANEAGQLVKGLVPIDGSSYYFDENGNMLANTTITIPEGTYVLDANGVAAVPAPPAPEAAEQPAA